MFTFVYSSHTSSIFTPAHIFIEYVHNNIRDMALQMYKTLIGDVHRPGQRSEFASYTEKYTDNRQKNAAKTVE